MKRGLTLIEVLVSLAVLGILLAAGATALVGTGRGYRLERERLALAEEAGFWAEVLAREVRLAGYLLPDKGAEVSTGVQDTLLLRYACEGEMEAVCGPGASGRVRVSLYGKDGGFLAWAGCLEGLDCPASLEGRAASRVGLEVFRVAYQKDGTWMRGSLTAGRGAEPVEGIALYLRFVGREASGQPPFVPGSGAGWVPGLGPEAFGLDTTPIGDGRARVERVVAVKTPNLAPSGGTP